MFVLTTAFGVAGCEGEADSGGTIRERSGFRALAARPLDLPKVELRGRGIRAGIAGRCLAGEEDQAGALGGLRGIPGVGLAPGRSIEKLRRAPFYAAFHGPPGIVRTGIARRIEGSRWGATDVVWASRPSYDGPVLVRGARVERPGDLGFGTRVRHRRALRLPAGSWSGVGEGPPFDRSGPLPEGWRATKVPIRLEGPGCYALQVDGEGFNHVILFGAQQG